MLRGWSRFARPNTRFLKVFFLVKPDLMQRSTYKCLNIYYPSHSSSRSRFFIYNVRTYVRTYKVQSWYVSYTHVRVSDLR